MSAPERATLALLAAAALHLGFQLTVTALVYPALSRVSTADWALAHRRHSRAIVPLVVVTYGALVLAGGWALATTASPWVLVAVAGAGLSLLTTALVAAPTHGRLSAGKDPALVRRLLHADYARSAGAVLCLVGAALAALR